MVKYYQVEINMNVRGKNESFLCQSVKTSIESVSEYLKSKGFKKHKLKDDDIQRLSKGYYVKVKSTNSDAYIYEITR